LRHLVASCLFRLRTSRFFYSSIYSRERPAKRLNMAASSLPMTSSWRHFRHVVDNCFHTHLQ